MTFDRERTAVLDRLSSPSTAAKALVGVLALTGVVLGALTGSVFAAPFPIAAFGLAAFLGWRHLERRRQSLKTAVERATQPDLWFTSATTGLVFADQHGIFVEGEQHFFDFAPTQVQKLALDGHWQWRTFETNLASISYEEAQHALKLQVVGHFVGETHREKRHSVQISLPSDVAADAALKLAVEANRRTARAA